MKEENCGKQHFYLFPIFFNPLAYNFEATEENIINPIPNDKLTTLPNRKSMQTTISHLMKMAESSQNE